MLQIRQGVFETNSSSSHSIVMMKRDNPSETIDNTDMVDAGWRIDDKGIIDFWNRNDLEFGRTPFNILTDWYGRLRYCIAYYGINEDKIKEIEDICKRRISGFTKFKFAEDRWDQNEYRGYVDHQSAGILDAALSNYNVSLEEFIFNDKFIVIVDGDEYCVTLRLMNSDMFNADNVAKITSAFDELDNYGGQDEE